MQLSKQMPLNDALNAKRGPNIERDSVSGSNSEEMNQMQFGAVLNAKRASKVGRKCSKKTLITGDEEGKLTAYKNRYCKGIRYLNLVDEETKNIAMVYVEDDIQLEDEYMEDLSKNIRYSVTEECTAPMFLPKDISLQKIQVGDDKKWVGLVALDTASKNGYLRGELPQCKELNYLPYTSVNTKVFVDTNNCCEGTKDRLSCKNSTCLEPLHHFHTKQELEYNVDVKGTTYGLDTYHKNGVVGGSIRRRRSLLQHRHSGC